MKSKSKDHAKQKQRQGAILLQNGMGLPPKKSSSMRPNQNQGQVFQQYAMQGRGLGKPDTAPNFLVNAGGAPSFY